MALEISEFATRTSDRNGVAPVLQRPALAVQTLPIGASVRSAAFSAHVRFLRVFASAGCRIRIYDAPEGADATVAVADGSDGQSEFFPAGEHILGARGGQKLAVIAAASA